MCSLSYALFSLPGFMRGEKTDKQLVGFPHREETQSHRNVVELEPLTSIQRETLHQEMKHRLVTDWEQSGEKHKGNGSR